MKAGFVFLLFLLLLTPKTPVTACHSQNSYYVERTWVHSSTSRGNKNWVKVFLLNSYLLLRHSWIDKNLLTKKWAGVCLAGDPQWASAVPSLGELPVSNNLRAWDGKGRAASWTFRRLAGQPCACGLAHSSRRWPGSRQVSDVASLCLCGPER